MRHVLGFAHAAALLCLAAPLYAKNSEGGGSNDTLTIDPAHGTTADVSEAREIPGVKSNSTSLEGANAHGLGPDTDGVTIAPVSDGVETKPTSDNWPEAVDNSQVNDDDTFSVTEAGMAALKGSPDVQTAPGGWYPEPHWGGRTFGPSEEEIARSNRVTALHTAIAFHSGHDSSVTADDLISTAGKILTFLKGDVAPTGVPSDAA